METESKQAWKHNLFFKCSTPRNTSNSNWLLDGSCSWIISKEYAECSFKKRLSIFSFFHHARSFFSIIPQTSYFLRPATNCFWAVLAAKNCSGRPLWGVKIEKRKTSFLVFDRKSISIFTGSKNRNSTLDFHPVKKRKKIDFRFSILTPTS